MKKQIYALTDYKNNFGSKWGSIPYRSGFNKDLLRKHFNKFGWDIKFIQFKNVSFNDDWENKIVIYTSSEEKGLYYKSYIEDIILGLGRVGAIVIPRYDFLRSNNNKVYMEILREKLLGKELSGISSYLYGTLEELRRDLTERKIQFPCVLKTAGGAMSRGVYLANNTKDLLRYAKRISRTFHCFHEAKEIFRSKKYKGYQKESKFQHKFIVQNFIPELINDWKILIFGNHYYVLNRGIKVNDFRASGSGYNYFAGSESRITNEMLNFLKWLYNKFYHSG